MALKVSTNYSSDFSRLISRYIESSGYSVYKISQLTGLGRTAIHQVMSGKLVPTKTFFEQLCTVFQITPRQKQELTELYLREKIGSKLYYEQKRLTSIIEKLPQYYIDNENSFITYDNNRIESGVSIFGLLNVNRAVINIMSKETEKQEPRICTTIPFENESLFSLIIECLGKRDNKAVFEHYIRLYKSGENLLKNNMDTLENLLKMSINSGVTYKPYSYYVHEDAVDDALSIFPYFLITSEYVILLTSDFQTAIITDKETVLQTASEHVNRLRSISSLMVEQIDNSRMFDIFINNSKYYFKSIEFQPCLTKYLTLDVIKERLVDVPEKAEIIETLQRAFFAKADVEHTYYQQSVCYYSQKGLENFARTGMMLNMPGHLLTSFSVNERLSILNEMKKDIGKNFKMLDSHNLQVPDFIQIIMLKNQKCLISCLMNKNKFCCILSEQSLYSAFYEFINALDDRDFTLCDEESLKAVDKCIRELEVLSV